MRKLVVCFAVLALAVLFTGSAVAENGLVSSSQLQAMGLSGMQVMSDSEAMSVRGKMFHHVMPIPHPHPPQQGNKPWTMASGGSIAGILKEHEGGGLIVGSLQEFVSAGKYFAGGATQADFELTDTNTTQIGGPGGVVFTVTKTHTISGATSGGVSSYAF